MPAQRIVRIIGNPLELESETDLARVVLTDDGTDGTARIIATGPASTLEALSVDSAVMRGGTVGNGGLVDLSPNAALVEALGAAGVLTARGGLSATLTSPATVVDGLSGTAVLRANGAAGAVSVESTDAAGSVAARGGTALDGGALTLSQNVATLDAPGAAGVTRVQGGLSVNVRGGTVLDGGTLDLDTDNAAMKAVGALGIAEVQGGTPVDGGRISLSNNAATLEAPGAAGVTLIDSGLTTSVRGPTVNLGEAAGLIGEFGVAATGRSAAIADAAGGATIDAEARTAINAILAYFRLRGTVTP